MKILVIQQKMIGDVLASSIICNNIKQEYPDAQVDYLIYPFTKPVVLENPNIDNIILFTDNYRKSKLSLLKFAFEIRSQHYDVVIDAYGKTESNLIVLFSGAKQKLGFYKRYTQFLYTKTVREIPVPRTNVGTALENRLNLLRLFDVFPNAYIKPKIWLTDAEIAHGQRILENHKIPSGQKILMIGVLGSGENKTYPFPFMAQLLDVIASETNAALIFNYMPSQKNEALMIYNLCKPDTRKNIKIDIVPGSIREFLAITSHCDALIGNEGGAVNMAKAIEIPTFTIFSTWIKKEAWNAFENGNTNISVHLKDFKPELYGGKSPKEMKKHAITLYREFTPDLILPLLKKYLRF
ncbi:MAG: glycosyltransferase [Flavobacterium sp. BFFFF1]|uniref:glycosyltransferase family 9 protein n=1 Tax=Flavobacterium sp. BFFFF1 TaxID=2015557 RepID=UPI000BD5528D|nr:glycosyltransferase family 9 protein [Flavobacterium sp. BFFFF1]OYU81873.1 MAG: glycosyltransferase [Flavobacterium sp. BFFFF1]